MFSGMQHHCSCLGELMWPRNRQDSFRLVATWMTWQYARAPTLRRPYVLILAQGALVWHVSGSAGHAYHGGPLHYRSEYGLDERWKTKVWGLQGEK